MAAGVIVRSSYGKAAGMDNGRKSLGSVYFVFHRLAYAGKLYRFSSMYKT